MIRVKEITIEVFIAVMAWVAVVAIAGPNITGPKSDVTPAYETTDVPKITNVLSFAANTSTLLIGANAKRKGLRLYNNSSNSIYLCASATCSSATSLFTILPTFQSFEFNRINYRGVVSGIRNAGTGNVVITEFE